MRRGIVFVLGLLVLAGCTGTAAEPAAPPQTLAGRNVARTEFGRLSGSDFGGAWDIWSPGAQRVIDRADFVALNTQCRPAIGQPYVITGVVGDSATRITVHWRTGQRTGTDDVAYQGNRWRFVPGADEQADYRLGVAALVARRRAAGQCR